MPQPGTRQVRAVMSGGRMFACDCSAQLDGRVLIAEAPAVDLDDAAVEQHDGGHPLIDAIAEGGHAFQATSFPSRAAASPISNSHLRTGSRPAARSPWAPISHLSWCMLPTAARRLRNSPSRWTAAAFSESRPTSSYSARLPAIPPGRCAPSPPITSRLRLSPPRRADHRARTQTTVQDYPGRLGYWHVGVPPSGPMDALAFRAANRLVGNAGIRRRRWRSRSPVRRCVSIGDT